MAEASLCADAGKRSAIGFVGDALVEEMRMQRLSECGACVSAEESGRAGRSSICPSASGPSTVSDLSGCVGLFTCPSCYL
jgi:hypothetical protein